MISRVIVVGLWSALLACAPQVFAQEDFLRKPEVPYVAIPQVTVDEMLRLVNVGPQDFVLDLDSGAGRSVTRWRAVRVDR